MIKKIFLLLLSIISISFSQENDTTPKLTVGLLIVATGKYIGFVEPLIKSADKYFCKNHQVTYFVFTDGKAPEGQNIVSIYQEKLAWPYATMMRYHMYAKQYELLKNFDYLFACDADMLFVDEVGDEILSERVGTLHPGYVGNKGTPEHRLISTAYIAPGQNQCYFAGGFNGGKAKEFLKLAQTISTNVDIDLQKNVIAVWHDESHLNKYYFENKPTLILSPSYCYWENHVLPYKQKLVALDKNHAEYQK